MNKKSANLQTSLIVIKKFGEINMWELEDTRTQLWSKDRNKMGEEED